MNGLLRRTLRPLFARLGRRDSFIFLAEPLEARINPAVFTVTSDADTGTGTLRQAIMDASDSPSADTIVFDASFYSAPRTITFNSASPQMNGQLTITGPGASLLTVQRGAGGMENTRRVFNSFATALNISGMTITGGNLTGAGGAGLSAVGISPNVTLDGVIFTNNKCDGFGGGIYLGNGGTLVARNSSFIGNSAPSGGGIYFFSGGSLLMDNCTLSGNNATSGVAGGGGLYFDGVATAMPPAGFTPSTLVIRNSAIINNNSVSIGAGIALDTFTGTLLVQNSTLSGNTAATSGGAIAAKGGAGAIALQDCTIANNTANGTTAGTGGGGIARFSTLNNTINLTNSIVSGNHNANASDIVTDAFTKTQANFSAIGGSAGFTLVAASGNNLPFGANLMVGILGDNGGATLTHAILPGSPLIGSGANANVPADIATDQRGAGFPRISGSSVDIGAFERDAVAPITVASQFSFLTPPQSLQFTFSENVAGSLSAGDLVLKNLTTAATIPTANIAISYSLANNVATFTFPGYPYGALPDGNYHAMLAAAGVTDASQNSLAADAVLDFYFLNGDANRDRNVGFPDLVAVAQDYGSSQGINFAKGDFTYDGTVDFADLVIVAQKYNAMLNPPSPAAFVSAANASAALFSTSQAKSLFATKPVPRPATAGSLVPSRPKHR